MADSRSFSSVDTVPAKNRKKNLEALKILQAYVHEAKEDSARKDRLDLNELNYREFRGDIDWSYKARGQSREHLPKMRFAAEQIAAIIKKGLVDLGGSWYGVDISGDTVPLLTGDDIRKLMNISLLSNDVNYPTKISDAVKAGYLESLMIQKIHGGFEPKRAFKASPDGVDPVQDPATGSIVGLRQNFRLEPEEKQVWRLRVDNIPYESYLSDPQGADLYEVHLVTRDLWRVKELAERGIYDKKVVDQLGTAVQEERDERRRAIDARGDDPDTTNRFRPQVRIAEVWGRLVDQKGDIFEIAGENGKFRARNVLATVANDKFLIRPPVENPNWDGTRGFIKAPLIRIPNAVNHDALGDHVRSLNHAIDDLFNLMLDAGIGSVHGIKQLRPDLLDDPDQVTEGIPPFETLVLRAGAPADAKVLERVDTGVNMGESIAVMNLLGVEFSSAALVDQIGLGGRPARQVKATEVVASQQTQGNLFDGITRDIEDIQIEPGLSCVFHLTMQHLHEMDIDEVVAAIGSRKAVMLLSLSAEERFALFANRVKFRVHGLTSMVNRAREFQKLMALLQVLASNPAFGEVFAQKYSFAKVIDRIVRSLEIDPETIQADNQQESEAQVRLLREFIEMQTKGAREGQTAPAGGFGGEPLPSAENGGGLDLPPGIEGGGGENDLAGASLNQRGF